MLPFPDAAFDVCRAARLLEHLPGAGQALSKMIRNGWIGRQLPRLFKEQGTLLIGFTAFIAVVTRS
jgi:hypothetical protein